MDGLGVLNRNSISYDSGTEAFRSVEAVPALFRVYTCKFETSESILQISAVVKASIIL